MRIAYFGFRMRLSDGWTMWGFESGPRGEEAYRESLQIPRSQYYKYVRIGQSLHQLPLEDLERIPVTNAELLIQVNPSIIHDHAWVQEAKTLKPAKLAELVTERNKSVGDDREPLVSLHFRVPFLAKRSIEEMVDTFRHKNQLSSAGQALELMIADRYNDSELLSTVNQVRILLHGVLQAKHTGQEDDSETWLKMAKELLDAGYEKALQGARKKSNRDQESGRA